MANEYYKPGDNWVIDDITGFKVRASETVKQWNGLRVHRDWAEMRNPQDFVRGVADLQRVPDPRPEAADRFLDTDEVTADGYPKSF